MESNFWLTKIISRVRDELKAGGNSEEESVPVCPAFADPYSENEGSQQGTLLSPDWVLSLLAAATALTVERSELFAASTVYPCPPLYLLGLCNQPGLVGRAPLGIRDVSLISHLLCRAAGQGISL